MKWYVYKTSTESAIVDTWTACCAKVSGVSGAMYQSFKSYSLAVEHYNQLNNISTPIPADVISVPPEYGDLYGNIPIQQQRMLYSIPTITKKAKVYTDGSAQGIHSGYGVYNEDTDTETYGYAEADPRYAHITIHDSALAEVYAILVAIRLYKDNIYIITDNQYCFNTCAKWYYGWMKSGKTHAYPDLWKEIAELSKDKNITIEWVNGHQGLAGNERADRASAKGSSM